MKYIETVNINGLQILGRDNPTTQSEVRGDTIALGIILFVSNSQQTNLQAIYSGRTKRFHVELLWWTPDPITRITIDQTVDNDLLAELMADDYVNSNLGFYKR
jgi:hypothetical protein